MTVSNHGHKVRALPATRRGLVVTLGVGSTAHSFKTLPSALKSAESSKGIKSCAYPSGHDVILRTLSLFPLADSRDRKSPGTDQELTS